jgi:hypothetical protein
MKIAHIRRDALFAIRRFARNHPRTQALPTVPMN